MSLFSFSLASLLYFWANAAGARPAAPSDVLANVNGEPVTGAELKADFKKRHGGHEKFLGGEREARSFLGILIDDRLLIQEAYRLEIENDPEVQKATREYEDRKIAEYFVRTELDGKSRPSQEQIQSTWERSLFESLLVRQVVTDSREDAEWAMLAFLRGADFDALARQCSIVPSWKNGGRLPPIAWGASDPEWEKAAFALAPGEFALFKTRNGWEFVQVEHRVPTERPEFEAARNRIEAVLKARNLERRKDEVSQYLWSKYNARVVLTSLRPETLHEALQKEEGAAVAVWDGGSLSARDFAASLPQSDWAGLPPGILQDRLDEQLRAAVDSRLAPLEARDRHLESLPEVAEAVKVFREDRMEGVLYSRYMLRGVTITDDEVRKYYDEHRKTLVEPERRRVSHIVKATQQEANAARARALAGESFEELARKLSTDASSAGEGGDLGWISKNEVSPEFQAVLALAEGEISEPMKSQYGYHLVKVVRIVPERPLSFDEAKGDIRKKLLTKKQQEKRADWIRKLRAVAKISINDAAIKAFVKKSGLQ